MVQDVANEQPSIFVQVLADVPVSELLFAKTLFPEDLGQEIIRPLT
jgi:hypothetical protein